ncbi:Na+/H+ antiporter subunit C [Desulfurococcus mucosus]|uniref:NADH-ubiquinone oxidoreductase chain 4L n=1 Tax=Desulfurococcus mucosus (strain ATCC 35584 / DSM 2162 / JCM 9187 / O7/1) TaxID=765177 RepID=E8R6Y7_DESM0|nr:Na+/H+ antiporter subunit C [Desulfurococcus mucosus]ADV64420.1 NADH-ubiquinone oxidoreductase chain 4L [Desulfurococcus mucosus DSM 2162]
MSESAFTWSLLLIVLVLNALISIYGIVYRRSLVKKLISLTMLSDTVFVVFIMIGYRLVYPSIPPILVELTPENLEYVKQHGVDPLPQALVLTGIVIGMAVNALIAFGIIQAYRLKGTTDARRLVEAVSEEVPEE